jgi:hypothetical protein
MMPVVLPEATLRVANAADDNLAREVEGGEEEEENDVEAGDLVHEVVAAAEVAPMSERRVVAATRPGQEITLDEDSPIEPVISQILAFGEDTEDIGKFSSITGRSFAMILRPKDMLETLLCISVTGTGTVYPYVCTVFTLMQCFAPAFTLCGSGSSFLGECGSGSKFEFECGSMRIRILNIR